METKQKVSFIHSITAKIMLMVVVVVALSLTACIVIADTKASTTVGNVNENYIMSLTESVANTLDKIPAEVDFSTQCGGCHAGHEHGGCFFSIWISCRF